MSTLREGAALWPGVLSWGLSARSLRARKPESPSPGVGLAGEDTCFSCSFSELAPGGWKALNTGWKMPKKVWTRSLGSRIGSGGDEACGGQSESPA